MEFIKDLLDFIFNFLIMTVIVKMIAGKWVAEKLMSWFTKQSERNLAIWEHYQHRALGQGHASESVLDCDQERCSVFNPKAEQLPAAL